VNKTVFLLKQRKNIIDLFKNFNLNQKLSNESPCNNYVYSIMCYPFKLEEISQLNFDMQDLNSQKEKKYMNEKIIFKENILILEDFASNELFKVNLCWEKEVNIKKYVK
jgi:hypothetical protein